VPAIPPHVSFAAAAERKRLYCLLQCVRALPSPAKSLPRLPYASAKRLLIRPVPMLAPEQYTSYFIFCASALKVFYRKGGSHTGLIKLLSTSYVAGRHPASAQSSPLTAALVTIKQMASAISSGVIRRFNCVCGSTLVRM